MYDPRRTIQTAGIVKSDRLDDERAILQREKLALQFPRSTAMLRHHRYIEFHHRHCASPVE